MTGGADRSPRRGLFVVTEGIDGSGTSTQARAVAQALRARGRTVEECFEPTKGPIGALLREFLAGRAKLTDKDAVDRRILAMLFAADRAHHLDREGDGIEHLRHRGTDVVCARYVLSSLAYEGDRPDELAEIRRLNQPFAVPDLTVLLECPVEIALGRITSTRTGVDIFENRAELTRVKANYEAVIRDYPGKIIRIDAELPAEKITARVLGALPI